MHWLVLSLSLYALKFHNSPPQAANSTTLPTNLSFHFPFHHCCCCSGRTATMNLCLCLLPSTGAGSRKKLPLPLFPLSTQAVWPQEGKQWPQQDVPSHSGSHEDHRVPLGAAPRPQPSHDRNRHLQLSQSYFKSKVSCKEPVWFCSQRWMDLLPHRLQWGQAALLWVASTSTRLGPQLHCPWSPLIEGYCRINVLFSLQGEEERDWVMFLLFLWPNRCIRGLTSSLFQLEEYRAVRRGPV